MLYVGSWYFLVMKEFLKKLIVGVLLIICIGLNFEKSNIIADEWSEPVKFYNSYGNSAVFKATNIYEGDHIVCSFRYFPSGLAEWSCLYCNTFQTKRKEKNHCTSIKGGLYC